MPIRDNKLFLDISYNPLPKQSLFHLSNAKYRLYIGAWRAGKTYAGCFEAYKHSFIYPNNVGIIFRKDYVDLRDTTMKTFFEIVPSEDIINFNQSEHKVVLRNSSVIYFRHLKQGLKLGSLSIGWFFIDEAEEVTEGVFTYLKGRLSLKKTANRGWLVSNPPNKDHWLYQHFEVSNNPQYASFKASTYENEEHLPSDYIDSLKTLPLSWQRKYLEGEYGFTPDGKPFYQGFKEQLHKRQLDYDKNKTIFRVWDYGYRHPACSFHQIDVKGRWLILKEIMGTDITIEQFGNYIKVMCKDWFPECKFDDYGDPSGEAKTDKSEKTSVEILASMGIFVTSKQSTYRERKEIIERKLATLIDGLPSLIVNDDCKIITDGFLGGYHYPERKANQAFNPILLELPYRDGYYEHLMNTVEYFAINMFTGAETKEDTTEINIKTVGDFKDVRYEYIEKTPLQEQYLRQSQGVVVEE